MADEDLEKDQYKIWVRGVKGLEYLQEGLQAFVEGKVQLCRNQSLQKVTNGLPTGSVRQCNQCTAQNLLPEHAKKKNACNRNTCFEKFPNNCFGSKPNGRRKCPNGICSKLYDEIVLDHSSRDPLWKNTDPSTWCSDPLGWSFGKCFQTTTNSCTSASSTDAAGLLSIIINNLMIQNNWLACNDMSSKIACPFNRARDIRNEILHSSKLELDDPTLGYYLDTFITVLQDAKCLRNCDGSKQAVNKLLQLKNHQINISQKEETRLEQNRIEALSELEEKTAEGLHKIDEKTATAKSDLEETRRVEEQKIRDQTKASLSEIEERTADGLHKIDDKTASAGLTPHLSAAEDVYLRQKEVLRDDLVTFYKDRHSSIPLSPLLEEYDTPLVDFYVLPQMNSIEVPNKFSGKEEIKTPITLSDMFNSGSKRSREIYLIADAGLGKTAFSKYLAVTWCQAHCPEENFETYFPEDAIDAMREFDFLFLVLLRDSSKGCSIDDLIKNQIMQNLSLSCTMAICSLQTILHHERCLVIIDGLDEWTHPGVKCEREPEAIPHRNARKKCTVLTTTRPWKLSVINLKTSQIDKKIELVKLTSQSAQTLKERAISKIKNLNVSDAKLLAEAFDTEIKKKQLEDLESDPLLLMYLICLWCDDLPLGKSKSELYTNIIELLLSRTVNKYPDLDKTCDSSQSDIPQFWSEHVHCKKYYALLKASGKLAFDTLFSKQRESTLVFSQSVADSYLNKGDLNLCLLSGILTQSKEVKLIIKSFKLSFSHKTVQE
ncbi:uncharacterized protein LOC128550698 [Mercenaria mercenaria]|uniref:uncharacterized protein LOC128550698 n=1 Tax=Mercenaria mercenaria TaxID=6596 RepID=UPI00234F08AF|nr:uncharacterized protein LOC128550698 [Mercenaria mercenaria]